MAPTISNTTLYIVYINVVLYATCYQLQRPIEPFMVERLGLTAGGSASDAQVSEWVSEYGVNVPWGCLLCVTYITHTLTLPQGAYMQLQSFFSVLQMVGSLFIGMLVDKIGSRGAQNFALTHSLTWIVCVLHISGGFILCFSASALSYGLLACATSIEILYISKIPTIFQAGFLCAQVRQWYTAQYTTLQLAYVNNLLGWYVLASVGGGWDHTGGVSSCRGAREIDRVLYHRVHHWASSGWTYWCHWWLLLGCSGISGGVTAVSVPMFFHASSCAQRSKEER